MSSDAIAIAAGGAHTCAVMRGGGVRCWGSNTYGQLGTGTTIDSSIPVEVSGLASEVHALAAGLFNTCALTSGGGVKCWGYAASGGLTDGPAAHSLVPIDITGLGSGIRAISTGYEQACALTTVGGVKCWGRNDGGQLGDGTTTESRTVVDVAGLGSGVSAVSVGLGGHTCALTAGGAVKCWGSDWHGQRGDGPDSQSLVPGDVSGLASGVRAITAGANHACALEGDGAVLCWGDNWYGQLGGGTECDSSDVPVKVVLASPSTTSEPTDAPIGVLSHATGPKDVVLRYGDGAVVGPSELGGYFSFEPGPVFTLYGDGTAIFWWAGAQPFPAEGPIHRSKPFAITHLDEDEIQALLRFALDEGGLRDACERYETRDTDVADSFAFTVRAGGLDKRVEGPGPNRFPELATHLLNLDRVARFPTRVFVPDRYWGNLFKVDDYWIELGILPEPRDAGIVPWPWPDIAPAEFFGPAAPIFERRVMSADEAAVLGLSDNGGVVAMVYLRGPDGKTIYSFSLWPMLPDQTS
jgi:alpha-tubulin suppressor-like RCC1 family protein